MKLNDIVTWTVLCAGASGPDAQGTTGFAVNDYL